MTHTDAETDLLRRLRGRPCRGTFEAHVTVAAEDAAARERFRALCDHLGVKCVLIELPVGATPAQPMTASYHRGDLPDVLAAVAALAQGVRAAGFPVRRLKLEAVATNAGVPDTDAEARAAPPGEYFEYHVKLLLPPDADLAALGELCARHDARLSANALKRDAAGRSERFVTLRHYGVGRRTSFARCDALAAALARAGYQLGNQLREYTLYDSAVNLDAGWLDAPAGGGRD